MTLAEIKAEVNRLADVISASQAQTMPTYGHSDQSGRPHIEVDDRDYHWVVAERGEEFERFKTREFDELLYKVFQSVTHELGSEYELHHRIGKRDPRRLFFQRQNELLSALSTTWSNRRLAEINEILERYPFDDGGTV